MCTKGLKATYITGEQCEEEVREQLKVGAFQLVYISPESILSSCAWREIFMEQGEPCLPGSG